MGVWELWEYVVKDIHQRQISFERDLLPCLSGIVTQLQSTSAAGQYLAGLWREDVPRCLVWKCSRRCVRVSPYRAPTWSWASVRYDPTKPPRRQFVEPSWYYPAIGTHVTVVDAQCTPVGHDANGAIKSGFLKLSGVLSDIAIISSQRVLDVRKNRRSIGVGSLSSVDLPSTNQSEFYYVDGGLAYFDIDADALLKESADDLYGIPIADYRPGHSDEKEMGLLGLVLKPSSEHEGCWERVGMFDYRGMEDDITIKTFLEGDETVVTIV